MAAEKRLPGPCLAPPGSGTDPALHPPPEQPVPLLLLSGPSCPPASPARPRALGSPWGHPLTSRPLVLPL